ncbi:hypothetical protein L5515_007798 [Caenorhabditis briggsae]|uniref:G protein-coupled receptor n=1 Tax=Caenorhabditis briggsae TaxID=6238 RepID=A0AAE9JJZ4_CAEBR|nr:hypothetical protein L5515_007798 [Caenorhabditis briggsae]
MFSVFQSVSDCPPATYIYMHIHGILCGHHLANDCSCSLFSVLFCGNRTSLSSFHVFYCCRWSLCDWSFNNAYVSKFGSVPSYIWCDNCMFINTDSTTVLIFVGLGASSQPLAAVYFGLSVYALKLGLQKLRKSLSQRTITTQRNFLNSLYLQTAVHVIFISVPLGIFFLTFILHIPSSEMYMSYILMAMFTQHGSLSTLALLVSNKPLYSVFTKTFLRMKTNIRGTDRVSDIRGAEREHSSWNRTAVRENVMK